ncbi:MAG: leucine-rich repeat domain-containing protein [Mycoplasmataceae bacterium]|nr:leucine-rich repeat domain-containing protein [Mycoplasmataceae bacterium]
MLSEFKELINHANHKRHWRLIACVIAAVFSLFFLAYTIKWNRTVVAFSPDGKDWAGYDDGTVHETSLSEPTATHHGTCAINGNDGFAAHNLVIPETVEINGKYYDVTEINNAFASCEGLTGTVTLPKTLKKIGTGAFYNCSNLTGIEIPQGVTYIGRLAFSADTFVKPVVIPSACETVEEYAFQGTSFESLVIEEGVALLGSQAFRNAKINQLLTIPGGVTIDSMVFSASEFSHGIVLKSGILNMGANSFRSAKLDEITADGWNSLPNWSLGLNQFYQLPATGSIYSINGTLTASAVFDYLKKVNLPSSWSAI